MKDLTNDIKGVVEAYNFDYMPTRMDLESIGQGALSTKIQRSGGFVYWRERLDLREKITRNPKWTNEAIEKELLQVVARIEEDSGVKGYMPTAKQINDCLGNTKLTSAITKNGGFRLWSEKLGLMNQSSTFSMGLRFEEETCKTLESMSYNVEMTNLKHPYDILLEGCVKINVKSCTPSIANGSRVHTIGISSKHQNCDLYYIYCLNEDGVTIEKELIIPSHHLSGTNLNMGKESKYDVYEKKFEYIESYKNFFMSIESMI